MTLPSDLRSLETETITLALSVLLTSTRWPKLLLMTVDFLEFATQALTLLSSLQFPPSGFLINWSPQIATRPSVLQGLENVTVPSSWLNLKRFGLNQGLKNVMLPTGLQNLTSSLIYRSSNRARAAQSIGVNRVDRSQSE